MATKKASASVTEYEASLGLAVPTDKMFRLMVDSVVDYALFILDPHGYVATWNRGAGRIKHYHADEIIGKHFSVFYPPESIANGLPQRELVMAEANGRHEDEGWRLRKGGARFWANVVITALRDERGQLIGFAKVTRDLSERRRAEQGLAAAYDQVNSVLECTSDAVVKIDRNWTLVYGNRKAADSLEDFFVGKNYWVCFPHVLGTPLENSLRTAMREKTQATYEIFYDPYQRWFRGNVFPTEDGLSVFFADVTDEKLVQDEREKSRYLKEKHVEALSHMAGGLAHEINNPLAIIYAKANDLMKVAAAGGSLEAGEVHKVCEIIVKTSDRAIRILRGLKGFGRNADKDPMETASIYDILDQCLELQGSRFERHNVQLRTDVKPDLPYVECREAQICQIITNLLNNAIDAVIHTAGGEHWVMLTVEQVDAWLHMDVTDSGPGIDETIEAHLMEPFITTKTSGLGMGIGLSLSKAMAIEHGGNLILCEDTANTCFRLTLPISLESQHAGSEEFPA